MSNVYVEPRPKGHPEGSHIDDYVVEDHADHALHTCKTRGEREPGYGQPAIKLCKRPRYYSRFCPVNPPLSVATTARCARYSVD
jgi:hypothetical protein